LIPNGSLRDWSLRDWLDDTGVADQAPPWPYPPDGAHTFFRDVALPGVERGERWEWTLRSKMAPDQIIVGIGLMLGENENRGFWIGLGRARG
jgi:hypothetical protein